MFNITQYLNERFNIIKILGEGGFGKATLIQDKFTSELQVMKEINLRNLDEKAKSQLKEEGKIISQLDHKNIIKLYDDYHELNKEYLFMEYADGGDLMNQITKAINNREIIPELKIINWFIEICEAIKYIHNKNILHRDLKELNIFLTSNNNIKLGDFGLAKQLNANNNVAFTMVGTIIYESPEILNGRPYDKKSDIWSLGVILYHLLTLKHPFMGMSQVQIINNITHGIYPLINSNFYSKDIINLCYSILRVNPFERPGIDLILNQLDRIKNNINNNKNNSNNINNNNQNQFDGNYYKNLYPNQNNYQPQNQFDGNYYKNLNLNQNNYQPQNQFDGNYYKNLNPNQNNFINNFGRPPYFGNENNNTFQNPYYQNNNNFINPYNQAQNNNNFPFQEMNYNFPNQQMNNIRQKRLGYIDRFRRSHRINNQNNYNANKVILRNLHIDNLVNINDLNNNINRNNQSKNTKIILSALSNISFDIKNGKMENGTEIILFERHNKNNQKWEIINNNDESISFKHDNYALSIENGIAENGKKIILWEYNGKSNQKFFIKKLDNDWVSFHSALNKTLCIDAKTWYNGDCLRLASEDNTISQQFKILE